MGLNGKVGGGAQKMEMERLRREDHLRVKHDKLFSDWKILVGPGDWKKHSAGEEGSQRYRLHNLPASYIGPGVYELGLTQLNHDHDFKQRKLRRHAVVVVYLGQADNVRQRLQRYGQSGSHLEGTRSIETNDNVEPEKLLDHQSVESRAALRGWFQPQAPPGGGGTETSINIQGGLGFFTEVFSRGYSIAFRWARTESKQMAEKVESELLHVFDYPWNTSLNGARRPSDILTKMDMLQCQLERSLCLGRAVGMGWRKLEYFSSKVGISVPLRKPTETATTPAPLKIPTSVLCSTTKGGGIQDGAASSLCGVLLDDGSSCNFPPSKGRRRCNAHKGQRVKVHTRQIVTKIPPIQQAEQYTPPETGGSTGSTKPAVVIIRAQMQGKRVEITDVSREGRSVCGAVVGGGSACLHPPLQGRKRCAVHKGMRTSKNNTKAATAILEEDSIWPGHSTSKVHSTVVSSSGPRRNPHLKQHYS